MNVEQKALELVNAVRYQRQSTTVLSITVAGWGDLHEALCRSIEAHETDKQTHEARDERLGEALYALSARLLLAGFFENKEDHDIYERVVEAFGKPFIIPQADPLVEAKKAWAIAQGCVTEAQFLDRIEARGLHIVAKGGE